MENLTEKESKFIKEFLTNNGCGAETPEELLSDNFSCQCIEDLRNIMDLSNNEIAGLLSSLQVKNVLDFEERDGAICESKNRFQQMNFEPDLYWASQSFLESLNGNTKFEDM